MQSKRMFLILVTLLALAALACNFSAALPDVNVSPEEMQQAAATAAAMAGQMGELAGTAVAQGDQIAATALAQSGDIVATIGAATPLPGLDPLRDKFNSVQPDADGNFSVSITQEEFNQSLAAREAAAVAAGNPPQFRNAQVRFEDGQVMLLADLTEPVTAPFTGAFRPLVVDGRLQFELLGATLGPLPVPALVLQTASGLVNNAVAEALVGLPNSVVLQTITVQPGLMIVQGQQR
jgi:hypothetical protein